MLEYFIIAELETDSITTNRTLVRSLDADNAVLQDALIALDGRDIDIKSTEYKAEIRPMIIDALRHKKISLDQAALILRELGILSFD